MTSPAIELQKTIFAALSTDAALAEAMGGVRIFDHAPANVAFPYISFGHTSVYDWSTSTESGTEHLFTLHVWSKAKGKAEALKIMELARTRLHDTMLEMPGHALVNLRAEFEETRFDDDLSVYRGILRFRAVIEPAA
ncbi:DUF3168 domain-containing protein [Aquamicrobium sp. LC103]|uniref:DUF3168 domain-containing protein n=1 Tax=Aquamicrobium sp. LC103 TaxID=1120658 RepID=UPI00063E6D72|nr:DUF3168 domain-containing protein [Aquamicrobium sp. LC103]TKT81229.1 DUF3168 domain-containing protein [Aquamicrobium sp. LC103]